MNSLLLAEVHSVLERAPAHGFVTVTLPLGDGIEFSVKL